MNRIARGIFGIGIVLLTAGMVTGQEAKGQVGTAVVKNTAARVDTEGNIVDAHDGCLEYFGGRFYLYGTRYGKADGFGKSNRYVCYSSADLDKWKFEGEILKNPPEGVYYRPYVKYNAKTKKYVLWYNWYATLWVGQYGVAVSQSPSGPFVIQDPNLKVKYGKPGDEGLFIDDDGTAYLIYTSIENDHGISIEKLSGDYLSSTLENSGIIAHGCEAPALFKKNGVYYALFDNCCCFCTEGSGARVYTAKGVLGPYTMRGNINRDEKGKTIIPAQQTHVACIAGPGGTQYIWMGDMWGSNKDGVKGHDLQYWSGPMQFDEKGMIGTLLREDEVKVKLPQNK